MARKKYDVVFKPSMDGKTWEERHKGAWGPVRTYPAAGDTIHKLMAFEIAYYQQMGKNVLVTVDRNYEI